jgi:hypothetical protein
MRERKAAVKELSSRGKNAIKNDGWASATPAE